MSEIAELEYTNARARFDKATGIAFITYSGTLSSEASTAVYDWLGDLIQQVGVENVYGEVFDFRAVTEFMPDNLMDARRSSRRYNMRNNTKRLPVSMIVRDFYQEEILRGPMQNVKENARKSIVRTMDAAIAFLHDWHQKQPPGESA